MSVEREEQEMLYSKRIRAGKRTYFFDVKATRSNDYYLTVTESRRTQRDGEPFFEKSKVFVYKEDFDKVLEALQDTINHIKTELLPHVDFDQFSKSEENPTDGALDSDLKWD